MRLPSMRRFSDRRRGQGFRPGRSVPAGASRVWVMDMASARTNEEEAMDQSYPVEVRARLDEPLSRWLWLVKWLLAIPHYIVLVFLWIRVRVVALIRVIADLVHRRFR